LANDPDRLRRLARDIEEDAPREDLVSVARRACVEALDLDLQISDLEGRLSELRERRKLLADVTIPAKFGAAGLTSLGIRGSGNLPDVRVSLEPVVRAHVSRDWDEKRRAEAFEALSRHGGDYLIKDRLSADVPRGETEKTARAFEALARLGLDVDLSRSVHHAALSKWLRERLREGKPIPPLDLIGGFVGQVAKFEEVERK
jgi:hypothetical protein